MDAGFTQIDGHIFLRHGWLHGGPWEEHSHLDWATTCSYYYRAELEQGIGS